MCYCYENLSVFSVLQREDSPLCLLTTEAADMNYYVTQVT